MRRWQECNQRIKKVKKIVKIRTKNIHPSFTVIKYNTQLNENKVIIFSSIGTHAPTINILFLLCLIILYIRRVQIVKR